MSSVYDEFLDGMGGCGERDGQRRAVELLIELSCAGSAASYAITAPTGTGKSYAALLAGVYNARDGKRTVIGTSTVVLSEQYKNEIRSIERIFGDVDFAVLKGASNYFCGNKAGHHLSRVKDPKKKAELRAQLVNFAKGLLPAPPIWAQADTDFCFGCAETYRTTGRSECKYAKARAAALAADVVVTTHAMIAVNMKVESKVLGDIHLTIFDEAHKASGSLIYDEIMGFGKIAKLAYSGLMDVAMTSARKDNFVKHFQELKDNPFSSEWKWYVPTASSVKTAADVWPTHKELRDIRGRFGILTIAEEDKREFKQWVTFLERARTVLDEIAMGNTSGGIALWVRGGKYKLQDMIPSPSVVKNLKDRRVAWLSATIGTASRPTYSLDKCGLGTEHYVLPSPFNYPDQLKWTVRSGSTTLPEAELIASINGHWKGGCVVLTGSHKRKERIAENLRARCPETLIQAQTLAGNTGNQTALLSHCDVADAGGSPILIGVEIFSTGIDLPGERLTKLVLAGLFPMRDDSAYSNWRRRWLESFDGDGFEDYELPERAIALEQQIGRVIRTTEDSGVVVFYVDEADWTYSFSGA